MTILSATDLTKYFGAELIFEQVSFQVARGDKIALVGPNGVGKSTLLKIIVGSERPSDGAVSRARGLRLAYQAQEARFAPGATLRGEAHAAFDYLAEVAGQMRQLEPLIADTSQPTWAAHMARYGELQARYEHGGGYEIDHRIDRTLHGLGFRPAQYDQPIDQFSGGQRTRAALAMALLADPDLLLLDEPTNHLDMEALEWLEGFLKGWDGTLITVSHDRYFLDQATTRTWDMSQRGIEVYQAAYAAFVEQKAARLEQQRKEYAAQQEWIAKTEDYVRRYKAGQRARQARGRQTMLERVKHGYQGAHGEWVAAKVERPPDAAAIKLALDDGLRTGEVVLSLSGLGVGYIADDQPQQLLHIEHRELRRGERVALLGPNGSGKTSLLRTLLGAQPALAGGSTLGANVQPAYYAQGHEGLDPQATALAEVLRVGPHIGETRARTLLGRLLFHGDDVHKPVAALSGGERSRVALAQLMLKGGNLLILDEPTNHLDLPSREALEGVLDEYGGAMLFVSHDRFFIDALADKIWMVEAGELVEYVGGYSDYAAHKAREQAAAEAAREQARQPASKERGKAQADPAQRELKRQLQQVERTVAQLEGRLATLKAEMDRASAALDGQRVGELGAEYAAVENELADHYERWAEVAQALEG